METVIQIRPYYYPYTNVSEYGHIGAHEVSLWLKKHFFAFICWHIEKKSHVFCIQRLSSLNVKINQEENMGVIM